MPAPRTRRASPRRPSRRRVIARRERERAVRRDQRERVRGREVLLGHEVRHRRVLRRAPQQGEDLDEERDDAPASRGCRRTAASRSARPARGRSTTITLRRSNRSTMTPPSVARKKPGHHPHRDHEAERGGRAVRDAVGQRQDREEPDPVAQAREDLREPELEERPRPEQPPRGRRDRVLLRGGRDERVRAPGSRTPQATGGRRSGC